jgi:hypothetical protein
MLYYFSRKTDAYEKKWHLNIIQNVSGGKVNILGGHSIGHSKQKSV